MIINSVPPPRPSPSPNFFSYSLLSALPNSSHTQSVKMDKKKKNRNEPIAAGFSCAVA